MSEPIVLVSYELDVSEVGCGECGAAAGEPCLTNKGTPYKTRTYHPTRFEFRDYFVDKATGNDATARWWRWKLRNEGPSAPPRPHGTMAAYMRHKREGSDPCQECAEAARAYWVEQNERLSESRKVKRNKVG